MRSFSGAINDYLCGRSKTLKQGDYGKQESDNDRFETINSRIYHISSMDKFIHEEKEQEGENLFMYRVVMRD